MTTATASGPWYEIQGLALCPVHGSRPAEGCRVPAEGEWLPLYHLDTPQDAKRALGMVIDSDEPMYSLYEDFRIAPPNERIVRKQAKEKARRALASGTASKGMTASKKITRKAG